MSNHSFDIPAEFHDVADAILRDPAVPGDVRGTVLGLYGVVRYLGTVEFYQDNDGVTHARPKPDPVDEPAPVAQAPAPVPAQEPVPPVAPEPTPSPATPPAPPVAPSTPAETPGDVTPAEVTPDADADEDNSGASA